MPTREEREFEPERHGTLCHIANFGVATWEIVGSTMRSEKASGRERGGADPWSHHTRRRHAIQVSGWPARRDRVGGHWVPGEPGGGGAAVSCGGSDRRARRGRTNGPDGEVGPEGQIGATGPAGPGVVEVNGKLYSLDAFYCGSTTTEVTGNLGGYATAKVLCESACGSPSAHLCDAGEMVRSAQVGLLEGVFGWFAAGTTSELGDDLVQDCVGFTWATHPDPESTLQPLGAIWGDMDYGAKGSGRPWLKNCSGSAPLLCCD